MATVAVVSYFTRVWIYLPAFDIAGAEWRSPLARTAGAAAVPAIIGAVAYDWLFPDQYWIVIPATAILYLASLAAIYLAWSPVERRDLHHIVRILRDVRIRVWRSRSPYTRPNEKAQSGR